MNSVSLKTLSAHLGLSGATVSRALNGYPDIADSTRERVEQAALQLGYRPNSNARRLATGDAECIGYVVPAGSSQLSEPFLADLLDGLGKALAQRHWDLMVSVARSPEEELATLQRLVQTRRVNGLVISRTRVDDARIPLLQSLGLPFITHGRSAADDKHAWFDVDNQQAMIDAVEHFLALGHRDIAHIAGPACFRFAEDRCTGYRAALAQAGITDNPAYLEIAEMNPAAGKVAMQRLLALREPPTAVVCVSDMVALGAIQAIRDLGWVPGQDVSVIGYDGIAVSEHTSPPLSTMTQPLVEAGQKLGQMLLALIDGDDPANHQVLVRASLTRRQTDGPPPADRHFPSSMQISPGTLGRNT